MLSELQRASRAKIIGSSDAPAICGVDPYRTPYDVWAEKTGRVPSFAGNDATEIGTFLEPSLLTYAARKLKVPITRSVMYRSKDGIRCANVDAIVLEPGFKPRLIEAKTGGLLNAGAVTSRWGDSDEGGDAIPDGYNVQIHHAIDVVRESVPDLDVATLVALLGGRGFALFEVSFVQGLAAVIKERCTEFYQKYIVPDIAPPDSGPSEETARAMRRIPGKRVALPAELVSAWARARDGASKANKALDEMKDRIMAAMGDAEVGYSDAGGCTFFGKEKAGYTVEPKFGRTLLFKPNLTSAE